MRARRSSPLAAGAGASLALGLSACASPTAITVDVYTEVDCTKDAEVSLTLADTLPALADSAPSSTSTGCLAGAAGHVGTVVIAPSGDEDAQVSFAVATRDDGGETDDCLTSPIPVACIVARRQLRFAPHLDLPMRVDLREACRGVDCPASQTCVEGQCVSAIVPASCSDGCTESALVAVSGGPTELVRGGGPGVRLVATKTGFAAAWPSTEPGSTHAVRLQPLGADATPAGAPSRAIALGADPVQELLIGYDGASFGLAIRGASTSFLVASAAGATLGGPVSVSGATALGAHGMAWSGANFAFMVDGPGAGYVTLEAYDAQATFSYSEGTSPSTWPVVAWDGTQFGLSFGDGMGSCWISVAPDQETLGPPTSQLATDCEDGFLAPRAAGGWHFVYQSQSTPTQVLYAQVSADGTVIVGPTSVSPAGASSYGAAQVVDTATGAAVFFAPSSGATAALYRASVDASAKLVAAAAPVMGVVVAGQSYEVAASSGHLAVAWYGRTNSPGASATGTYATTLTGPP